MAQRILDEAKTNTLDGSHDATTAPTTVEERLQELMRENRDLKKMTAYYEGLLHVNRRVQPLVYHISGVLRAIVRQFNDELDIFKEQWEGKNFTLPDNDQPFMTGVGGR